MIDAPLDSDDTVVLETQEGNLFKIGNPVDNDPGFQGTWEGRFVGTFVKNQPFNFEAVCFGTGDFEGLIAVMIGTREVPGDLATIDVYITDPDKHD